MSLALGSAPAFSNNLQVSRLLNAANSKGVLPDLFFDSKSSLCMTKRVRTTSVCPALTALWRPLQLSLSIALGLPKLGGRGCTVSLGCKGIVGLQFLNRGAFAFSQWYPNFLSASSISANPIKLYNLKL